MKKYMVSIMMIALVMLLIPGIALAQVDQQFLVPPDSSSPASGRAMINFRDMEGPKQQIGMTLVVITVFVRDLEVNTEYEVWIGEETRFFPLGIFTTDRTGRGRFHLTQKGIPKFKSTDYIVIKTLPPEPGGEGTIVLY